MTADTPTSTSTDLPTLPDHIYAKTPNSNSVDLLGHIRRAPTLPDLWSDLDAFDDELREWTDTLLSLARNTTTTSDDAMSLLGAVVDGKLTPEAAHPIAAIVAIRC